MPTNIRRDIRQFHNKDLVLSVGNAVDRKRWNEDKYEAFLDELCGDREYQKEAIRTTLRYFLAGEYADLRALAKENYAKHEVLKERYGSFDGFEHQLNFPDKLAATLDLATGTGKSYVLYGVAAILLAEGIIDRVLLLCPSTTIESGLKEKFEELAGDADLRDLLPASAAVSTPRIIDGSESIVSGSICIENYHAVLAHVRSSIRDSLSGHGSHTLILNDETHHIANEKPGQQSRWREFLSNVDYGFKYVLGVSGTCYIDNEYFPDVIYRYSLREAIEERFVKKIRYVAEMPTSNRPDEKWQVALNQHTEIARSLRQRKIKPITIVVTPNINRCQDVTEELKAFLVEHTGKNREQIDQEVISVYSGAPDLPRLTAVNNPNNKIEWILSVSMLNEGWDVKRVFQIVPHEERAFNSKLLIAQVLGRGLRIPNGWTGEQPVVTVLNHDNWASRIKHLVDEIMEMERRIPTFSLPKSSANFDLLNIEYTPRPYVTRHEKKGPYNLLEKGYVDLPTEGRKEDVSIELVDADTDIRTRWNTTIQRKTYTTEEIVEIMRQRLEEAEDDYYSKQFPPNKLRDIVETSKKKAHIQHITDSHRQRFLQALGTLRRKEAQVVKYEFEAVNYIPLSTKERPTESVSASELRGGGTKTLFITPETKATVPDEAKEFFAEITEEGSGYQYITVRNKYDFKTPLNAVIADHDNEKRFIKLLTEAANANAITSWIKSTPKNFYQIDYSWKKGEHPKRGVFNPDFFINTGNTVLAVEIKSDAEIKEPSPENPKKYEYAVAHFENINKHLTKKRSPQRYKFNFLTPADFNTYFQSIREGSIGDFQSQLDIKLRE